VYGSRAPVDGARSPLSGRYPGWPARSSEHISTRRRRYRCGGSTPWPLRGMRKRPCVSRLTAHVNTCAGTRTRALYAVGPHPPPARSPWTPWRHVGRI